MYKRSGLQEGEKVLGGINQARIGVAAGGAKRLRAAHMPRTERREQLLEVARTILEEEGLAGLSMAGIAVRAGVSKPVVYEHFANSEAVAIAILEQYFDFSRRYTTKRLEAAKTIEEYITIVVDSLFDQTQRHDALRAISNGFSASETVNAAYQQQRARAVKVYQNLLQQQGVDGEVASVAAHGLFELQSSLIVEFHGSALDGTARTVLKKMLLASFHSLSGGHGTLPVTPDDI